MAGRPHLARAQAQGAALTLPSRRAAAVGAGLLALFALAYLAARETPLFALESVEISGAPPTVREAVREEVDPLVGESLVALDGDGLRRRLEALPSVRSLHYDRAFPHTLRIVVRPERPAAVLRRGPSAWLVSERGRVMESIPRTKLRRYPRIWLLGAEAIAPGELIANRSARAALAAVTRLPARFPARVRSAWAGEAGLTLVLARGTELRLGDSTSIELKLAVAARVLRSLSPPERADLAYLDVAIPERPVGADASLNSQVEP